MVIGEMKRNLVNAQRGHLTNLQNKLGLELRGLVGPLWKHTLAVRSIWRACVSWGVDEWPQPLSRFTSMLDTQPSNSTNGTHSLLRFDGQEGFVALDAQRGSTNTTKERKRNALVAAALRQKKGKKEKEPEYRCHGRDRRILIAPFSPLNRSTKPSQVWPIRNRARTILPPSLWYPYRPLYSQSGWLSNHVHRPCHIGTFKRII